jgi:hypothetical protein
LRRQPRDEADDPCDGFALGESDEAFAQSGAFVEGDAAGVLAEQLVLTFFVYAEDGVLVFKNRSELDEFRCLPKMSSSHNNRTSVLLVVVALKKTIDPLRDGKRM